MGKARPYIKDIEKSGRKDLSNGAPRNNYVGFTFIVYRERNGGNGSQQACGKDAEICGTVCEGGIA